MTTLKCRHCGLPWHIAAMTACPTSESGKHEFERKLVAAGINPESET